MAHKHIVLRMITPWSVMIKRNLSVSPIALQKATDPIQQLFVEKLREYKKKSSETNFYNENPALKKAIADEENRILNVYGGTKPEDMSVFPTLRFSDPVIDPQRPLTQTSDDSFEPTQVGPDYYK